MTEENKNNENNENNELVFHTGLYQGKTFVKKGNKKDGTEWVLWNIIVKADDKDQYGTKFKVFGGCKGWDLLTDEIIGEPINLGFVRGSYSNEYGVQESRTVAWIGEGELNKVNRYESSIKKPKKEEVNDDVEAVVLDARQIKLLQAFKDGLVTNNTEIDFDGKKMVCEILPKRVLEYPEDYL